MDSIHECESGEDFEVDIMQNCAPPRFSGHAFADANCLRAPSNAADIPKIRKRCAASASVYDACCGGWEAVRDTIIAGLEEYEASGMAKEGVVHGDPVRQPAAQVESQL